MNLAEVVIFEYLMPLPHPFRGEINMSPDERQRAMFKPEESQYIDLMCEILNQGTQHGNKFQVGKDHKGNLYVFRKI